MHTVKHAAALTGISPDRLRMWERRYAVVEPARTAGGYRVYDDAAIARLTAMRALVEAGWPPRRAALQVLSGTTLGATLGATAAGEEANGPGTEPVDDTGPDRDLLVGPARALDGAGLARSLDRVFPADALEELVDPWLMPALARLGAAWRRGDVSVAGEHFVSAGVQRRLSAALDAALPRAGAPRVLVGLPRGCRHELGALAFAALLARAGVDAAYLGADLPAETWVVAATTRRTDAVVLAVPTADDVPAARDTVAALAAVRPDLPLQLGGGHQAAVRAGHPLGHLLAPAARGLAQRLSG